MSLTECLTFTLSPDTTVRISAELKLAELLASPATGLELSQLILSQDVDMSMRQMSSPSVLRFLSRLTRSILHSANIILRKYVKERWSPYFPSFKGSAPPVEVKTQIREAVFRGLSDPNRKIRSLCAHTLASIANCDWPDEYPELLTKLIQSLSSDSSDAIHGALQLFAEFMESNLTEDQILPVLRELLPVLLNILGAPERHSALTRSRAVSVFRQCVTALFMVKDHHPQAVKEATASVLPIWFEAFKVLLAIDPAQDVANADNWDGLTVRIQIFKTLDAIHTSFPRAITPYLKEFLGQSLNHLTTLYPTFSHYYLSSADSAPRSSEDDAIDLPQLVCPIIDFVSSVTRGGKAKAWFSPDNLNSLIGAVFSYVQMTDEDEETWASNANAFVQQEEDETQAYSVRVAGFDLLACMHDREPAAITATFQSTIKNVVSTSTESRSSGAEHWWRPLEAALAAIGSQAEAVLDCLEDEEDSGRGKPIDIEYLLSEVIPSVLSLSQYPFLQGRGFVFASQYTRVLPGQLAGQYLEAAIQVVEASDAGIPVKISAVKAIHNFCQGGDDAALLPFAARIAQDLGPFLSQTSEDTLTLVLETISVVVEVDKGSWVTDSLSSSLVAALLEVWSHNNKDPIFLSVITDILEKLSASTAPGIYETVLKQALPYLNKAIAESQPSESWIAGSATDLVTSLAKGAPEGELGEGFFALIAENLFRFMSTAVDRDAVQSGVICLTIIIRKECGQLLGWSDASGRSGLDHVLAIVAKLLQNEDESGGLVIGDLIIHLLRQAGQSVLPVLPELLQAMVVRMTTAKTASFLQSLLIPFAFLINNQLDTVISLLETNQVGDRSSLNILVNTWCENAETFQGFWPTRISQLAMSQMYASERPSLQQLMVKGDIIVKESTRNVIMTRSRTKSTPHEFTSVPFPVKALKILLRDLQSGGDSATIGGGVHSELASTVDSDDEDEEWDEEEKLNQGFKADEFAFLSEMIGPKGMAFDNDDILEDSDDEDLKNDPVSQMDMQAHLVGFFRDCATRNPARFSSIVGQLSAGEMVVVQRIVGAQE